MIVTRKNVPRPVITINQQNGIDYIFLIILLLYLVIFLATLKRKATDAEKTSGSAEETTLLHHKLIGFPNTDRTGIAAV
jgi:hypothetical protein